MILIQSTTVSGTATSSVTFSSIPQDGTSLVVVGSSRNNSVQTNGARIFASGSGYNLNANSISSIPSGAFPNNTTPNFYAGFYALIPAYTRGGVKTALSDENDPTDNLTGRYSFVTSTSGSVTSLTINLLSGTFADQSRFAIYKITAGTGGATFS